MSPSQIESGSRTSAESTTSEDAERERAERLRQPVDDAGERLTGRRQRDEREEGEPEREVGDDRAVARIVVAAGGVRLGHGRRL